MAWNYALRSKRKHHFLSATDFYAIHSRQPILGESNLTAPYQPFDSLHLFANITWPCKNKSYRITSRLISSTTAIGFKLQPIYIYLIQTYIKFKNNNIKLIFKILKYNSYKVQIYTLGKYTKLESEKMPSVWF